LGKSLVVQIALIQEAKWTSRDETVLTFAADIEPLVIGKTAAMRRRDMLGEGGEGLPVASRAGWRAGRVNDPRPESPIA
jgi:hypothetical protein